MFDLKIGQIWESTSCKCEIVKINKNIVTIKYKMGTTCTWNIKEFRESHKLVKG